MSRRADNDDYFGLPHPWGKVRMTRCILIYCTFSTSSFRAALLRQEGSDTLAQIYVQLTQHAAQSRMLRARALLSRMQATH